MEISERLTPASRQAWRAWLAEHLSDKSEIWLVLHKRASGRQALTMAEAQEEALCFGWIDSHLKPIDASSYALRFSPRRPGSEWSETNRARALKLLRAGQMTPAGMALLPPDLVRAWQEEETR